MTTLRADHPAVSEQRTIFIKQVKAPEEVKRLIQPAANNKKLGGTVQKGKWKGYPMYQLSLQERATCPRSCGQWNNCYGNAMPFANRVDHESEWFYPFLEAEIDDLARKHKGGFVIRLHVLGDFFSKDYVRFWTRKKRQHKQLEIFGYSHFHPGTGDGIGEEIEELNTAGAWIRFSDRGGKMSANVDGEGITCPEQTGKTAGCNTCGLCWSTELPVRFLPH